MNLEGKFIFSGVNPTHSQETVIGFPQVNLQNYRRVIASFKSFHHLMTKNIFNFGSPFNENILVISNQKTHHSLQFVGQGFGDKFIKSSKEQSVYSP